MNMADVMAVGGICLIILLASLPILKRMKKKESCCGTERITVHHKKLRHVSGKYRLHIDGMHCKNCEKRVTEAIQEFEGLSCRVSLERMEAVVEYETEPMVEEVMKRLGELDFLAEKR